MEPRWGLEDDSEQEVNVEETDHRREASNAETHTKASVIISSVILFLVVKS